MHKYVRSSIAVPDRLSQRQYRNLQDDLGMGESLVFEYLTAGNVAAVLIISTIASLIASALSSPTYPQFPWVGEGQGLWPWIKGNVTFVRHYADWVQDGYKKV